MNCVNHPDEDAPYQCHRCRQPICVDCETKLGGNSICPACLAQMREQAGKRLDAETRNVNYPGGILAGALAAAAAGLAWSQLAVLTGHAVEVGSIVLGGVVGYAVRAGAGHKCGPMLQQIAAVLALVGIIFGYLLIFVRMPAESHQALMATADLPSAVYAFPEYLISLKALDWFLLALGVAWAYWVPHVRSLPKQPS